MLQHHPDLNSELTSHDEDSPQCWMWLLDVVWLRRDVHLHDHALLEFIRSAARGGQSPISPLSLYELD